MTLDHATSEIATGAKLGTDATKKLPSEGFKRPWPPLVLGLIEIQQAVHAAICALAVAFLERAGVNERERPMLELELVQFRQPLRAGEIRGLALFLKLQFLAKGIFQTALDKVDGEISDINADRLKVVCKFLDCRTRCLMKFV
ncbi:MAG: hypothetical protein HY298_04590 [Verrucomicrobia bacterium]|nr:hypothetical protein [Verrucomicrobiota bacterium]